MRDDRRRELTPRELHRQRRKEQIARRRLVAALCLLGLIILIIVLVATCGPGQNQQTTTTSESDTTTTTLGAAEYTAELAGEEVSGTATFVMTYDPDTEALDYELMLEEVDSPNIAKIYEIGEDGASGTPIYVLYDGETDSGEYTGRLAFGSIDVANLTGSLDGGSLADLIQLISDGKVYVAVGTAESDPEAIKGDLLETTSDTETTDSTVEGDTESTDTTDETDTTETTEEG